MQPYWRNEAHNLTIYHGDCLQVMPQLEQRFDLCLTDPPYNVGRDGIFGDDLSPVAFVEWLAERYSTLCANRLLAFSATPTVDRAIGAVVAAQWKFVRLLSCYFRGRSPAVKSQRWVYLTELVVVAQQCDVKWPGEGFAPDWYEHSPLDNGMAVRWGANGSHPSRKRLGTMLRILRNASLPTYAVIDPFLGSGTTLVACYRLGRSGVGIEISEEYCELAARRLETEIAQGRLFEPAEVEKPVQTTMEVA